MRSALWSISTKGWPLFSPVIFRNSVRVTVPPSVSKVTRITSVATVMLSRGAAAAVAAGGAEPGAVIALADAVAAPGTLPATGAVTPGTDDAVAAGACAGAVAAGLPDGKKVAGLPL